MKAPALFENISPESIEEMIGCFKPEIRSFRKGETILVYSSELEYLCLLLSGRAHMYCTDSEGEYTLLENYGENDVFGELVAAVGGLGYAVQADSACRVMFIRFDCIYGRCPRACQHHSQLTSNLFRISARKAQELALRINMISKKSIRRKLEKFLEYQQSRRGDCFEVDMSLSQLAGYLCVDRSSMMRELKAMCDEGLIRREGRKICIINLREA